MTHMRMRRTEYLLEGRKDRRRSSENGIKKYAAKAPERTQIRYEAAGVRTGKRETEEGYFKSNTGESLSRRAKTIYLEKKNRL